MVPHIAFSVDAKAPAAAHADRIEVLNGLSPSACVCRFRPSCTAVQQVVVYNIVTLGHNSIVVESLHCGGPYEDLVSYKSARYGTVACCHIKMSTESSDMEPSSPTRHKQEKKHRSRALYDWA